MDWGDRRQKLEEALSLAFTTYERYWNGGALPSTQPGFVENAHLYLWVRDHDKEFESRLGWGDFSLISERGGPETLHITGGPVFILPTIAHELLNNTKNFLEGEETRNILFTHATCVIDKKNLFLPANKKSELTPFLKLLAHYAVRFISFEDTAFQDQISAKPARECLEHILTHLVQDKIGVFLFEELMERLSATEGDKTFTHLKRVYERWLALISFYSEEPYSPNLYKGETLWAVERERNKFKASLCALSHQRGIDPTRDLEELHQAELDALKVFDPEVARELKFARVIRRLYGLGIYKREALVDFGAQWNKTEKKFFIHL